MDLGAGGIAEIAHFDSDGDLEALQWTADVEPVIEANKAAQCDGNRGFGESREWRKVASIPLAVLMEYAAQHGIPLQHALGGRAQTEIIERMLGDADYRYLRTDI
ncbi:MAG: hypothetical protein EPO08_17740 [Rhodospirillaceae bacterium]|nr:MAG: hypothetical protein EPO08_17740 [Rhodospirillaceae bacterium]